MFTPGGGPGASARREGRAREWLGEDVGDVLLRGAFVDCDGPVFNGLSDECVVDADPLLLLRHTAALGAVEDGLCIGVDGRWAEHKVRLLKLAEEDAKADDDLDCAA